MRAFVRAEAPSVLKEKWEQWGNSYEENRKKNPGFTFQWPQVKGEKLNQLLLPHLQQMTQRHCSYCDGYPPKRGDDTIDHFKPKSNPKFYKFVCHWENLYVACKHCQDAKMEQYSPLLLRPDELEYDFNIYFEYNYTTHKINVNPLATAEQQERAAITIQIFDSNHSSIVISRRHQFERYLADANPVLDDYSYRFMLL